MTIHFGMFHQLDLHQQGDFANLDTQLPQVAKFKRFGHFQVGLCSVNNVVMQPMSGLHTLVDKKYCPEKFPVLGFRHNTGRINMGEHVRSTSISMTVSRFSAAVLCLYLQRWDDAATPQFGPKLCVDLDKKKLRTVPPTLQWLVYARLTMIPV